MGRPRHHGCHEQRKARGGDRASDQRDIPEAQRWTDTRRGERFSLTTLNVRLLPDGHLAVKAYGRPTSGGRSNYVPFPVPDDPKLASLIGDAAQRAGSLWTAHRGLR